LPLPPPLPLLCSCALALIGLAAGFEALRLVRSRSANPEAERLAALFLALAALHLGESALATSPLVRAVPHLHSTTYGLAFGFGPALWLLARRTANLASGRTPSWLHVLPVLVGTTSLLSWLQMPAPAKVAYVDFLVRARPASMGFGGLVAAQLLIVLGLVYGTAAARLLHTRRTEPDTSDDVAASLDRLADAARLGRNAFAVYLPAFVIVQVLGWHTYQLEYAPSVIGAIALIGFARELRRAPAIPPSTGRAPRGPGLYRKASLPAGRVPELLSALEHTMVQERAFLDPALDVAGLATRLGITAHQLSQLLNRELGVTFTDYVNGERVREARRILDDPGRRDLTILAVALDVGFRSKNTFTNAFKKHAGTTPSVYRRD
jgi:AraC-like DNA-binding protein